MALLEIENFIVEMESRFPKAKEIVQPQQRTHYSVLGNAYIPHPCSLVVRLLDSAHRTLKIIFVHPALSGHRLDLFQALAQMRVGGIVNIRFPVRTTRDHS